LNKIALAVVFRLVGAAQDADDTCAAPTEFAVGLFPVRQPG
jgi:hypothetical protein